MGTSVVPAVIGAFFDQCTTALPDVNAMIGFGATDDPGDFLMIGVDDPDGPAAAQAVDEQQAAATMATTRPRDETFDLSCAAFSWNGDGDQMAAITGAFTILTAVENLLRTDPRLAISTYSYLVAELGGYKLNLNVLNGANALIMFTIHVRARI